MNPALLVPVLTPHGHLSLAREADAVALDEEVGRRLEESFARGAGHGLLQLGAGEVGTALPAVFSYWREFAARYMTALCTHPSIQPEEDAAESVAPPPDAELEWLAMAPPLMTGAEYLTGTVLRALWRETDKALRVELSEAHCGVQEFLKHRNPAWNLVGRVCFNLAENRGDAESPFAFLATYTVRLSAHSKAQHLPLGQALREYEGPANRDRLLSLLLPVQRAAESCAWLKAMVEAGEIYHPLRWTPGEATQFLRDCPQLEQAGCRTEVDAFAAIANQLPRPSNWTFYIVCDEKTWKDVVNATGTAKKGFDYFSVTPTTGASVDTTKRVSYIRGWALIHPTKATPEPEFIVADTLARVILNTSDDNVARSQVSAWLKDRNTQVAVIK